jgi:hypothetical protein
MLGCKSSFNDDVTGPNCKPSGELGRDLPDIKGCIVTCLERESTEPWSGKLVLWPRIEPGSP